MSGDIPERPRGYTDFEWDALQSGATLRRGKFYEDGEYVHEICWPSGQVADLRPAIWPKPDAPFLQPDYIAVPVVGTPGEPIALWQREGGAG